MIYFILALFSFFALKSFFFRKKKGKTARFFSLCLGFFNTGICLLLLSLLFLQKPEKICLTLTGETEQEVVEWKNPYTPIQKETLKTYNVLIATKSSQKNTYFFGELIGIRKKTLELHPFFSFIGVENPSKIECIQSDYICLDKIGKLPGKTVLIDSFSTEALVWFLWEKLFYKQSSLIGLCSSKLSTEYLPLIDEKGSPIKKIYFFP
jgi:hypothetical protein